MKEPLIIRRAKMTEADVISELAIRSKAHWGYSAEFMTACREELTVTPEHINDSQGDYFVCEVGGEIIGYCATVPTSECERELEALFVDPQCMGSGYGRTLLDHAKETACKRGARVLLIQSDPNAAAFYAAIGATHIGDTESGSIPGRFLPEYKIELPAAHGES
ncbi:MAG: GNAT family N-acetyltransferase [Pseudomonadota bacterium]